MSVLQQTALYQCHQSLGARMVPFAGWSMPIQYNSILKEAKAVRTRGGIFDVSHMGRIRISGNQATELLNWILTANIKTLAMGKARYSLICDEHGGIIDDGIIYCIDKDEFLLVCNASNINIVLSWLNSWRRKKYPTVVIEDNTLDTVMIAIQGPCVLKLIDGICSRQVSTMGNFSIFEAIIDTTNVLIARTGYTGEEGVEIIAQSTDGSSLWDTLLNKNVTPCGLGSRDVLRLEAGLPLYGNDIDLATTPLEAGLNRFVSLDTEFVGSSALILQNNTGILKKLVGLNINDRRVARQNDPLLDQNDEIGVITSGTYSPTLDRNISMGYVSNNYTSPGQIIQVNIRGNITDAIVTNLPFYTRNQNI